MKTLVIIFLFLILLVVIINSEFTLNDKIFINKAKQIVNNFSNTVKSINNNDMTITEKNGIINFLKNKLKYDDIMIPKIMNYEKNNNDIIFKNIKIIGINYENDNEKKNSHNIDLIFTINTNNMFLSQHYLFSNNGTFTINYLDESNDLDMIPNIIHLTTEEKPNNDIDSDSELNTTEFKDIIIPSLL
jgi:hypothetical protein